MTSSSTDLGLGELLPLEHVARDRRRSPRRPRRPRRGPPARRENRRRRREHGARTWPIECTGGVGGFPHRDREARPRRAPHRGAGPTPSVVLGSMTSVDDVTDAGWNPDPTGRHELRYWDGSTWTDHVSDRRGRRHRPDRRRHGRRPLKPARCPAHPGPTGRPHPTPPRSLATVPLPRRRRCSPAAAAVLGRALEDAAAHRWCGRRGGRRGCRRLLPPRR